ncbi:class E sortase [Blastococcus sp. TF02A-30]|uniref:class E sortase n=1 Tax=Blastococcus sp. TF02A-30 TaxID=2250580 RepID=UPI001F20C9E7|nr:class E sortase [Blastococcus sp. TF02A-30]
MSSTLDVEAPATDPRDEPPARHRSSGDVARTVVRGISQTLITLGLVALLFVVYQLWVTDLLAARAQDRLTEQLQDQWAGSPALDTPGATDPTEGTPPADGSAPPTHTPAPIEAGIGDPFAILHIPRLGDDYARVVVQGSSEVQLEQGPGHYVDTAMPGEQGNFSVAGHRVGRGSPFLDLDRMRPGDAIVVETADSWFVYRVLGDPATGEFTGDPTGIPGREVVRPSQVSVIAPTPGGGEPTGAYLTLTTCHPRYSAAQRLILHARLDGAPISKAAAPDGPAALAG